MEKRITVFQLHIIIAAIFGIRHSGMTLENARESFFQMLRRTAEAKTTLARMSGVFGKVPANFKWKPNDALPEEVVNQLLSNLARSFHDPFRVSSFYQITEDLERVHMCLVDGEESALVNVLLPNGSIGEDKHTLMLEFKAGVLCVVSAPASHPENFAEMRINLNTGELQEFRSGEFDKEPGMSTLTAAGLAVLFAQNEYSLFYRFQALETPCT